MSDIKKIYDKDHVVPEPRVELGDDPVIVWGPKTTINHLADASERVTAWRDARDAGASVAEISALAKHALASIVHPTLLEVSAKRARLTASPSAPETQGEPNANGDSFGEVDLDAPQLTYSEHRDKPAKGVAVKLPKTQLKLKL